MIYSIKNNVNYEMIINKSKFITLLKKVNNEEDVKTYIENLKNEYKGATHYCYAYIIDNIKRFDDDKEPNGTAGLPILEVLSKNNLNYVLCVVIRYFGGIKLGSGGLVRAYSKSAREALKLTKIVELVKGKTIQLSFTYDDIKQVDNILKDYFISNKQFTELIIYTVDIKLEKLEEIKKQLNNINTIKIKELDDIFMENN
ncbi:MAG: YigZ family protein [Bacilli bacterium]|nr:YigZ family protein [Bacilli bacterium]